MFVFSFDSSSSEIAEEVSKKFFGCANEPFARGYPAERGQVELPGQTPNGLSAGAILPDRRTQCQYYFLGDRRRVNRADFAQKTAAKVNRVTGAPIISRAGRLPNQSKLDEARSGS
jgi:hypothetical protein